MAFCHQLIYSCSLIRIINNRSEYCVVIVIGTIQDKADGLTYIHISLTYVPYGIRLTETFRYYSFLHGDISNRKRINDCRCKALFVFSHLKRRFLSVDGKVILLLDTADVITIGCDFKFSTGKAVSLCGIIAVAQLIYLLDQKFHRDLHRLIRHFKLRRILPGIIFLYYGFGNNCSSEIVLSRLGLYHIECLFICSVHRLCYFHDSSVTLLVSYKGSDCLGIILTHKGCVSL